ncbi:hypothetical protein M422DRAFT_258481 [Sphaerobolus stellatus SS14]|uniref:Unplaced genomic scaffold SPHSTscaffold_82, whole genome shotgun sequence n=1 Tax=Sphaerobolus stellatus (strain SS14) TaxID=990650 RepID=A0A0C9UVG5_SPHS4|nr:hypothetical protein M422DRAFT_258481 [Sphaerobolus stellatus SS14]
MSKFTCAMTNRWTLENIILHGSQDGIGIDTSWRNMNENRAGVTFITGVDRNGHLVPCSALLSANIKVETLRNYLMQTEQQVVARANEIIAAIPNAFILICQFHIIQAILRLDVDSGIREGAPRLSLAFKFRMLIYFRQAQRCRTLEEWPSFREHFFQRLKRLASVMVEKVVQARPAVQTDPGLSGAV